AAVYLVEPAAANGSLRLVLVASEPVMPDEVPAPVLVSGAACDVLYVPDVLAIRASVASEAVADASPGRLAGGKAAIRTYFRVPTRSGGRTSCLVEFAAESVDAFPEADRDAVLSLAPLLGCVLDNARRQQTKDVFLALAAHELRTPLTTAAGFAQTIADHFDRLDPAMIQDLLARILRNHRRLDRLVDDLVDLSSIEGGHLQVCPGPVSVALLLDEVVRSADSGSHPVSCQVLADLPLVWADHDRLEQVVTNLVANAAKFSPEGAPIIVRAGIRDELVAIEVIDDGPGIAPELQERIFDAYYQGDAVSGGRPRGLGIGLYLTRLLCQLMGGTVDVESQPGRGSTFVVTLPPAASAHSGAES
ncbi:MAG TPA: HAMP domain-containing sensor histidine kinase, partial [Acidimicrobiales bacterium]|nr:HAMP domain-containing sensor histidine kinase [Acidimicrobiales bacterium]